MSIEAATRWMELTAASAINDATLCPRVSRLAGSAVRYWPPTAMACAIQNLKSRTPSQPKLRQKRVTVGSLTPMRAAISEIEDLEAKSRSASTMAASSRSDLEPSFSAVCRRVMISTMLRIIPPECHE